eukprot:ANDGO_01426.mRNA.1 Centrosomal protein of 135 kDa OS=Danio rerio GN=cep135 PE=3 SV=2
MASGVTHTQLDVLKERLTGLGYAVAGLSPQSYYLVDRLLNDLSSLSQEYGALKGSHGSLSTKFENTESILAPLKKEIARKLRENGNLHAQIIKEREDFDAQSRSLQLSVRNLESEVSKLKFDNVQLAHKNKALEVENQSLKDKVVKNDRRSFIDITHTVSSQAANGKARALPVEYPDVVQVDLVKMADAQIERLQSRTVALEKQLEEANQGLELEKNKTEVRDQEISRLQAMLQELPFSTNYAVKSKSTDEWLDQVEHLHSQLAAVSEEKKRVETENTRILRELHMLKLTVSDFEVERAQLQNKETAFVSKVSQLSEANKENENERAEHEAKEKELQRQLKQLRKYNGDLERRLKNAEHNKQAELDAVQMHMENQMSQLQELMAASEEELTQTRLQLRDCEDKLENMQVAELERAPVAVANASVNTTPVRIVDRSVAQWKDCATQTVVFQNSQPSPQSPPLQAVAGPSAHDVSTQMQSTIRRMDAELDQLRGMLDSRAEEVAALNKALSSKQEEARSLEFMISQLEDRLRDEVNEKSKIVSQIESEKHKVDQTSSESMLLRHENAKLQKELGRAVDDVQRLQRECQVQHEHLQRLLAQESVMRAEIRDLTDEKIRLRQDLDKSQMEWKDLIAQQKMLSNSASGLKAEKDALERAIQAMREGMLSLEQENSTLKERFKIAESDALRFLRDVKDYEMQCQTLARACESLSRKLQDRESDVSKVKEQERNAKLNLGTALDRTNQVLRELGVLQVECEGWKKRVAESAKEKQDLENLVRHEQGRAEELERVVEYLRGREYELSRQVQSSSSS